MLQINMADVMNVIGSLTPYLIAIGVLFALALIITFAVNKKTVKEVATRKIVHSESWLVALVGIVVAVSMMLTGPLSTLLNNATTTKYMLSDTTVSKANELAKEVQSEAITMLKFAPQDASLPVRKVLESAIANARVKADKAGEPFRENDLVVKETYVDEGVTLKRFRARAQGRAARINKRTSHITVVVANKEGNR